MFEENGGPPDLGGTKRDFGRTMLKGAIGAIPYCGAILAEVVGQIIPEQRIQRLESYVKYLNDRLSLLSLEAVSTRLRQPENVDLFEEGANQSARALSQERIEYIANLVSHGLLGEEKERLESKRLFNILREVDDDQIIMLTSHLQKYS